jgi:hypothetical protein
METFEKVAFLDTETQARLLDSALSCRAIPHVMVSYRDSVRTAPQRGWGYVEATERYCDEVLALLEDLKHPSALAFMPLKQPLQTGNQARV